MHFSPADLSTAPVADAHSHAVFGLGSLASVANIAVHGASLVSLVGPVLLGVAALWQAWTARQRLAWEREKDARDRVPLSPAPVVVAATLPVPAVSAPSS